MEIGVVTDSTASLSAAAAAEHGITVVPLTLVIDGVEYPDLGPDSSGQLVAALREKRSVTTSRPSPQAFLDAYRALARDGATEIVSVHLSERLSGTLDAARVAAAQADVPVHLLDTRSVGSTTGQAAIAAASAVAAGSFGEPARDIARSVCESSTVVFYVHTLEYLRRGGRIGAAAAFVGQALAIKPLLTVTDGLVSPLERVRTSAKALARMEEIALDAAARHGRARVVVEHLDALDRAETLAASLRARLGEETVQPVSELGAVIGAHAGPGCVAVSVTRSSDAVG